MFLNLTEKKFQKFLSIPKLSNKCKTLPVTLAGSMKQQFPGLKQKTTCQK